MSYSKDELISLIKSRVGTSGNSSWTIGITNRPYSRKDEHSADHNVKYWRIWEAHGLTTAQLVESYFINLDMKGGTDGHTTNDEKVYVYIF